jgi:hypothetical protein
MNAIWITPVEPADPVDLALGDLVPPLLEAVSNRWGLHGARLFWHLDPTARRPLTYGGPDEIIVSGESIALPRLAQAAALALLHYHPADTAGIYDYLCHGLANEIAQRVTGQAPDSPAPGALPLASALLRQDGDLALRVRALSDEPPPVATVAPLVFDQHLPQWLRRRLRQAALVGDDAQAQSARREAALWRWLASRRFIDLWPTILRTAEGQLPASSGSG